MATSGTAASEATTARREMRKDEPVSLIMVSSMDVFWAIASDDDMR